MQRETNFRNTAGCSFAKLSLNEVGPEPGGLQSPASPDNRQSFPIRLDTIVYSPRGNILTQERHYYVTSLSPDIISAHGLLRLIRNHWQIENSRIL